MRKCSIVLSANKLTVSGFSAPFLSGDAIALLDFLRVCPRPYHPQVAYGATFAA
jgi:hypothetical protein